IATYFKDYDISLDASSQIVDKYKVTPQNEFVGYWEMDSPGEDSIFELQNSSDDNVGTTNLGKMYRSRSYGDIQVIESLIKDAEFDDNDVRSSSDMIDYKQEGELRNMGKYPDEDN